MNTHLVHAPRLRQSFVFCHILASLAASAYAGDTPVPTPSPSVTAASAVAAALVAPPAPAKTSAAPIAVQPAPPPVQGPPAPSWIEIDRIDGDTIHFKPVGERTTPKPLHTGLSDLKAVGTIHPPKGQPYFLIEGRPCHNCIDDQAIYLFRPAGGKPVILVHPGKIFHSKNKALLMESRAFYGNCIRSRSGEVYVVFQKERVDRKRRLQSSVFVAEPTEDHVVETLIERHMPRFEETLRLVKKKQCKEIEPRNRMSSSRRVNLHPKKKGKQEEEDDSDDEKDDEAPKENQTDKELPPIQQ